MMILTIRNPFRLWTLILSLVLGILLVAQSSMAQGVDEDYHVTIVTPPSTFQGEEQEIVVQVHTLQGVPAHGIPVRFQLDPEWQGDAKIMPAETTTEYGLAQVRISADIIGYVGLTVRVGFGTVIKRTGFLVESYNYGEPGSP